MTLFVSIEERITIKILHFPRRVTKIEKEWHKSHLSGTFNRLTEQYSEIRANRKKDHVKIKSSDKKPYLLKIKKLNKEISDKYHDIKKRYSKDFFIPGFQDLSISLICDENLLTLIEKEKI